MFITRLISGIVLILIIGGALYKGGIILAVLLALLSVAGMREYYKAVGIAGKPLSLMEVTAYVCAVGYLGLLFTERQSLLLPGVGVGLIILMAVYVLTYPEYRHLKVTASLFPLIYVAVMLGFIYLIRCRFRGNIEVWLVFLSSWGADTCAYCVGRLFGRHKMSPRLSPNKSVEGAVGGVAGAAILGAVFAAVFRQPVIIYAAICAVTAVISIFGDLAASAIKREAEIKDYSHLIPGHGGILDRFDSVLFTAPVIYLCCELFLM